MREDLEPCVRSRARPRRSAVGAGRLAIEGKGIEGRFSPLQAVLSTRPFVSVVGGVGPGGELCHGDRADGELDRQLFGLELVEVDDDGGIDDAPQGA